MKVQRLVSPYNNKAYTQVSGNRGLCNLNYK